MTIRETTELMRGFARPWAIAGGWAIDLFLARETRAHADVDLAVFREDQDALRKHLRGWTIRTVVAGEQVDWGEGERLELPIFELHAERDGIEPRRVEFLLNECDGQRWIYRRDPRITCPVETAIIASPAGIPFLSPAIVLLYKAKAPRVRDHQDFGAVRNALGAERRAWLREALLLAHPNCPWIALL